MIEARELTIGRNRATLLAETSFRVRAGECWAVVGRNGSGKSTLLATLAGLIPALAGEVEVLGKPLRAWRRPELARHLGFLPQHQPVVFPYTVEEFVGFGCAPWRHLRPAGAAVDNVLASLGLQSIRRRALTALSGGEAQRVCIAQLLVQATNVLLLDEPLAHLDLLHQVEVMRLLRRLAREGHAVMVVTHDLTLAWRYCQRFLVLGPGGVRVVERPDHTAMAESLHWAFEVAFDITTDGPHVATMDRCPP